MQERLPLRPAVSVAMSSHTLLLNREAVEYHILRTRVTGIVPDLEREPRPFGNGAAPALFRIPVAVSIVATSE